MRFGIVGGGPAGLYLAILLKRADPSHDVTVVERNPADATYGWGVVFSEETLSELRAADLATFVAVDRELVRWNALDIRYRGQVLRSRGHGFSAISRLHLLTMLQDAARSLGVDLRFGTEVGSAEVFAEHDVVVAADGVHSALRAERADAFGTAVEEHGSTYVWYGTDLVLDVFTFIFRETEHGLFTVHGYPFDATTSTFIVECSPDTHRRAGLHEMGERDSLAFCEELFADHLDGHRLRSNRSLWTRFLTVRNGSWHDGNVVLVGDAAYTAHFSIGSGTKLAMEDAIALQEAFIEHGDDLDAVFAAYEADRQPVAERFQRAAVDSARYFETVSRYLGSAPEQFAFNLLTRSGRITHRSLELRDPPTVNRTERWLRSVSTGQEAERKRLVTHPPRLAPLRLADRVVANRVVMVAPTVERAEDGRVDAPEAGALAGAVDAGAGLVVTEPIAVSAHGRLSPGSPGLYEPAHVEAWGAVLERHRGGALVAARLTHAGRRGAARPRHRGVDRPLRTGGWPLLAPSPLPYTDRSATPAPLDARTRREVLEDVAAAADMAARAGFDVLLLDLSDGYLFASFLSPLANRRDDDLGGDLDGRATFPLEAVDAARDAWPDDRPFAVRLNADDRHRDGFRPHEAVAVARRLRGRGADLIDVVAGHTVPWGTTAPDYRAGYLVELSAQVRNEADVATLTSGAITTLDQVDTIVAAGRADLVVLDPGPYRDADRGGTP